MGFIDGMHLVGNLIERGQIDFGLVVDGESSRTVVEATLWPHAEIHRFPDCGHWVLEDAPDEIAACVRSLLSASLPA